MSYEADYKSYQQDVEAALEAIMAGLATPEPLLGAMRYSLLSGGKRIRSVMLLAACEAVGGVRAEAMPYACALEMIHTYSLVHDDLPAMDDDDLRRGRLTNHKVFGEGMAILAGDGLLSLAFETMANAAETAREIQAMRRIALAAGTVGMVAGQAVDVTCEANNVGGADELVYIHRHKTADLFIGAVTAGLLLGGATEEQVEAGARYAEAVGVAFQIRDDLLDVEGDAQTLGKATGMDAARGKLTWPGQFGLSSAKHAVKEKTDAALDALEALGAGGKFLREAALYMLERDR